MAENYYPFDSGLGANITEQQWRFLALALNSVGAGVIHDQLNELNVYGLSDGLFVHCDTGRAGCFGHYYENTVDLKLPVAANGTGTVRVDIVALKFDFAANTAHVIVITGGAAAPNIVQDISTQWTIPLGYILVPANANTVRPQDTFACLDRFGAGTASQLPIGAVVDVLIDFGPTRGGVPSGFIALDGAQYSVWSLPKICGKQTINGTAGVQLVPDVGASFQSGVFGGTANTAVYIAADHRDRLRIGGINMGTPAGTHSTGIDASHNQTGGAAVIDIAHMPAHGHAINRSWGGDVNTPDGAPTYLVRAGPPPGSFVGTDTPGPNGHPINETGGGQAYVPPYTGVCSCMKVC